MKKTFKRVVSVLAMLCLFATQFAAFAAEDATTATEFANGTEYEYNLYDLNMKYLYVNSAGATFTSETGTNVGAMAIFKLPLPKLTDDQKITNYKFMFPETHLSGNTSSYWRIVRLDGSTSEWDKKFNGSLTTSDPAIKQTLASSSDEGWSKYNVSEGISGEKFTNTENYTVTVDISSYANEKYMSNESDHFYVGVYSKWTAVVGWNQSIIADDEKPRAYVTPGNADSLELVSSNIANHALGVDVTTPIEFLFNRKIISASAVVNKTAVTCSIANGKVTINKTLEQANDYDVNLTVVDSVGTTIEKNLSFSTYYGDIITETAYNVTSSGSAKIPTGKYVSLSKTGLVIYKLPFPKLEPGQKIGKYIFRQMPAGTNMASYGRYVKIPWHSEEEIANITLTDSFITPLIGKDTVDSSYIVADSVKEWSTGYAPRYSSMIAKQVNIDLTTYANECYNAGQRGYFLLGCNSRYGSEIYPWNYANLINKGYYNGYYYSVAQADELTLMDSFAENGDAKVQSSSELTFKFNNGIESAVATLNSQNVNCTIDGSVVALNASLKQYEEYNIELDVEDIYGQSKKETLSFATSAYVESGKLKDGSSYYITNSANPVEVTSKNNVDKRSSHVVVYRIPVPENSEGKILDSFIFNMKSFSQAHCYAYKLPGDDWELTEDINKDEVLLRFDDIAEYVVSSNYVCPTSDRLVVDLTPDSNRNKVFDQTYDITTYANECIARNENYIDIAVCASSSTMDVYGFKTDSSTTQYAAGYEYSLISPEFRAINIKKTVDGASLNALSFGLLTEIDNVSDAIGIVNITNGKFVEAEFVYDASTRSVALVSPVDLPRGAIYEIVIKSCTDKFGNILGEEMVITTIDVPKTIVASLAKIVAGDSSVAYDEAVHSSVLDKASSCKAIAKISNNTSSSKDVVVAIAQYVDETVVNVEFTTVTVPENASNFDVASKAITLSGEAGKAKAFVWSTEDNTPLASEVVASVN